MFEACQQKVIRRLILCEVFCSPVYKPVSCMAFSAFSKFNAVGIAADHTSLKQHNCLQTQPNGSVAKIECESMQREPKQVHAIHLFIHILVYSFLPSFMHSFMPAST